MVCPSFSGRRCLFLRSFDGEVIRFVIVGPGWDARASSTARNLLEEYLQEQGNYLIYLPNSQLELASGGTCIYLSTCSLGYSLRNCLVEVEVSPIRWLSYLLFAPWTELRVNELRDLTNPANSSSFLYLDLLSQLPYPEVVVVVELYQTYRWTKIHWSSGIQMGKVW